MSQASDKATHTWRQVTSIPWFSSDALEYIRYKLTSIPVKFTFITLDKLSNLSVPQFLHPLKEGNNKYLYYMIIIKVKPVSHKGLRKMPSKQCSINISCNHENYYFPSLFFLYFFLSWAGKAVKVLVLGSCRGRHGEESTAACSRS